LMMKNLFRYFKTSPEIIRLAVMMYVRFPLSLRQVEDLLHERGIDISHETVRAWWNRFGPVFASEIRKRRFQGQSFSLWRWHLDEVCVRINGEQHYHWRAVDHEGEVLESFVTKRRARAMAKFRSTKSLRKFTSIHNHFNQERHLRSRQNFKVSRSAAHAEWCQIGA
jgi:putative transposase